MGWRPPKLGKLMRKGCLARAQTTEAMLPTAHFVRAGELSAKREFVTPLARVRQPPRRVERFDSASSLPAFHKSPSVSVRSAKCWWPEICSPPNPSGKQMAPFAGNGSAENWLAGAIQECQRVADFRPANSAELYERLAQLAAATPCPRNRRATRFVAVHLIREACLRIIGSVVGARPSDGDAFLRWPSLWTALTLIGARAQWDRLAPELRELAHQNRGTEPLPRRVERHVRAHFASACTLSKVARDAGASTRVLTRTFRQHHNCTVHQFLSSLRLRAAVRMLEQSDLTFRDLRVRSAMVAR